MISVLDQLKAMTNVVADTGTIDAIEKYHPVDCTTNPSIVLSALQDPRSEDMIACEIEAGSCAGKTAREVTETLTVAVGAELTKSVPGRVSTEVDACLSFDTNASVARGRNVTIRDMIILPTNFDI